MWGKIIAWILSLFGGKPDARIIATEAEGKGRAEQDAADDKEALGQYAEAQSVRDENGRDTIAGMRNRLRQLSASHPGNDESLPVPPDYSHDA